MGTRVDISMMSNNPTVAAQTTAEVEHSMLQWSKDWYPWGTTPGELKRLNAAFASGKSLLVSTALRQLLEQSKISSLASNGYFDPAIAPMVKAWGFDGTDHAHAEMPDDKQLTAWKEDHPTMQDVIIKPDQVYSTRRDVQLDLGAIAKGYAIDLAMQHLQQHGIQIAAINMGGQVKIMGNMDEQLRRIQIRDPRSTHSLAWLLLNSGESISTSGDYERFIIVDGRRIHHLLDPHTGRPVQHTQMVTVIAPTATLADAASTALMAAGPDHWQHIAKQMGVSQVLRVDATGEIQITAAMYAHLHWDSSTLQSRHLDQVN